MGQTVFKLNRKLKGIKDHNIYNVNVLKDKDVGVGIETPVAKEKIITDARLIKRLQDRVALLESELQHTREESFQAGYDEGKQRTMQDALNRIEAAKHEMHALEDHFNETLENLEKPLLELAKIMAEEVIHMHIKLNDETDEILKLRLHSMLEELIEQNHITIQVNPDQLNVVNDAGIMEQLKTGSGKDINFTRNERLAKGEAIAESEDYYIDGRFENNLGKLKSSMEHGDDDE